MSLYRKYHYLEYLKKYEEIYELISRESVYTGKYDEYVEEKFPSEDRYSTEVDEVFLKQINEWRLEIGDYLYHMDSTYRDIEFLNDAVQEFINQIIFLRICEDRNLPLYQSLKETAQNKVELQDALTKVFKEVDKKYNSKLFAGDNIIFDLNNEIIFNMILSLYYPKTPYGVFVDALLESQFLSQHKRVTAIEIEKKEAEKLSEKLKDNSNIDVVNGDFFELCCCFY